MSDIDREPEGVAKIGAAQLAGLLDGWSSGPGALHVQLSTAISNLIDHGELAARVRLPSERDLARALAVSRTTTLRAYRTLSELGTLDRQLGSGTWVAPGSESAQSRPFDRLQSYHRDGDIGESGSRPIDLSSGAMPGLPLFSDTFSSIRSTDIAPLLQGTGYLPRGLPVLREAIAAHLRSMGVRASADEVLITSGAQQALEIAAASLAHGRNDLICVENPTYRGALQTFRSFGPSVECINENVLGWPSVADARSVQRRSRPSFFYLQSTINNPLGVNPSEQQLAEFGAFLGEVDVTVVDDISTANTALDGSATRPLAAYTSPGRVITIGTLSKVYWAGLRVGWMHADRAVLDVLAKAKGGADLGTSSVSQILAVKLLEQEPEAREQRRLALQAGASHVQRLLSESLPEWMWQPPTGGGSMWVKLPYGSATGFTRIARKNGVELLPGPTFSANDSLDEYIRIPYTAPLAVLTLACLRLAAAWEDYKLSAAARDPSSRQRWTRTV